MKKTITHKTICILAAMILFASYGLSYSQQQEGQSVVTISTGLSKNGIVYKDHTCLFNATYDYGIKNNFSLGLAFSHQQFTGLAFDAANSPVEKRSNLVNIGFRPLYHLTKREDLDIYTGVRLGCSLWNENQRKIGEKDGASINRPSVNPNAQLIAGVRWFLDRNFGVNCELALGSPYFFSLGVHYKL